MEYWSAMGFEDEGGCDEYDEGGEREREFHRSDLTI